MNRIFAACLDIVASMVFILPIFIVCNKFVFHKIKHTALYTIFAFYLIAMMSLVGLPNVKYMQIDFSINLIPFVDMVSDIKNALLNVLLFIPFGVLFKMTFRKNGLLVGWLIGFLLSMVIESSQLVFHLGLFEWDDMLHNSLGCLIGLLVVEAIKAIFCKPIKRKHC